ncbi:asparagine synthase (glutamine-hydrolysing) [Rubritalea squalenifaciens DSM 18772]|uniref:asparagine synthase (glutamine-hydrolyzing) n=1 Tax=Rubritalea squalenifaciens DSM 18772 TaxID=1123071 RepID=A0A1M6DIH6_9BACT|nr:asparagine synthase (glutamine-hydrolyzing) [Rubritalea squalenifaciens]SHI72923.1 asparagine synthase (glutamine-hydrolysing) [Rubritalea squalenifaciens DSM 18772]
MCGFLFSAKRDEANFSRALEVMHHRGPDASGEMHQGGYVLGHRRLIVVDLDARSNQPFYSPDGKLAIVYNGEIYNHKELARKHHLDLHTTSDTEVLLLLYQKLGAACLQELNGMFAFVVLHTDSGKVFAARDRLGIKPLHIDRRREQPAFASEVASLLELDGHYEWDVEGLRQYIKLRTCFGSNTVYQNIEQLPAGCYYDDGRIIRYWQMPEGDQEAPGDEEVDALLRDAVKLRCMADVPLGSYLSGGLDSTIIARLAGADHVWSVGFEDHNEFSYAQLAADQFGMQHHACVATPESFQQTAKKMIQQRREPLSVPNEVLIYLMSQQVKTKNTVVLSGEGADELFFGYDRIFRWAHDQSEFSLREFDRHYSYGSHRDDEILDAVISPYLSMEGSVLGGVARFFQLGHLHGLLRRLDFSTMLASVEARVPFVDHRLVERMAGVPFDYRMGRDDVKLPLKRIYRSVIPHEIIERPKVGFPVPLKNMPFYDPSQTGGVMDQWLKFNLRILSGCDDLYLSLKNNLPLT